MGILSRRLPPNKTLGSGQNRSEDIGVLSWKACIVVKGGYPRAQAKGRSRSQRTPAKLSGCGMGEVPNGAPRSPGAW